MPLALENPVVVRRDGPLHVLDFMARLHTRTRCPLVLDVGHLVCIDTFCYGGGWLTALDVDTDEIWQVDRLGQTRPPRSG